MSNTLIVENNPPESINKTFSKVYFLREETFQKHIRTERDSYVVNFLTLSYTHDL